MQKYIGLLVLISLSNFSLAQEEPDTLSLNEVIVQAFNQQTRLNETPVSMHVLGNKDLSKVSMQSILPALNALPGIRMEERSPGSYRLNVRGSSLRSPFGVRNVKTYFNHIPYTEPGGITYLNQLSPQQIKSVEIIKGPGSSMYGAGTGGVLLINSFPDINTNFISAGFAAGSYGYRTAFAEALTGNEQTRHHLFVQHQASDGYRHHTNMERNLATYALRYTSGKNELSTFLLAGYLYYQTPGALNINEFKTNPRQSRPGNGNIPGAAENHAAIHQQTILTGMHNVFKIAPKWQHQFSVYGSFIQLTNPNIRNYEQSNLPHTGGRTSLIFTEQFTGGNFNWQAGTELQQSFSQVKSFLNNRGNKSTLQSSDDIRNRQHFIFTQATLQYKSWVLTGGLSLNNAQSKIERDLANPPAAINYAYQNILAPRLALLKKLKEHFTIYTNIAKGFSPPTTAEVFPSGGTINLSLRPETGVNYEAGARFTSANKNISIQTSFYYFKLDNTIVQRRDAAGGDQYINAGATNQKGIEVLFNARMRSQLPSYLKSIELISAYTYSHFQYQDFTQLSNDYSGNRLPGVPPHVFNQQLDIQFKNGCYLNMAALFNDAIYLNDANSVTASSYWLLQTRAGYEKLMNPGILLSLFAGIDNLLNQSYSLGNDINGFGGRYYNAAPRRNFFAGINIRL